MSPERVYALLSRLPDGSAFLAARSAPELGVTEADLRGWTLERLLTVRATEALRTIAYVQLQKSSKKTIPVPEPIPTPFDGAAKKSDTSPFADMLRRAKEARAAKEGQNAG